MDMCLHNLYETGFPQPGGASLLPTVGRPGIYQEAHHLLEKAR